VSDDSHEWAGKIRRRPEEIGANRKPPPRPRPPRTTRSPPSCTLARRAHVCCWIRAATPPIHPH